MSTANLRALEAQRDKQIQTSNDISERINAMRDRSGPEFDKARYDSECIDFATSERQLSLIDRQIKDLRPAVDASTKTAERLAVEASPSARFIRSAVQTGKGSNGLEGWEAEVQADLRGSDAYRSIAKPTDYVMPLNVATTANVAGAIAHDTMSKIVEGLANYGGARKTSEIIRTAGGNSLDIPKSDESTATGEQMGSEGSAASENTPADVTDVTLTAYTYSSKFVEISREALADTEANGIDLIGRALRLATARLGRITNQRFTTGTGTNQPEGFLPRAGAGITSAASGGAANITYTDLVKMIYTIDSAYLDGGEMGEGGSMSEGGFVGWTFHRNFESIVMQMLDGDNRPLWAPGLSAISGSARQNMLVGYPYVLNYDMPSDMTGGSVKTSAIFGALGGYHCIRDVDSILIRVIDSDTETVSKNKVRIIGFSRSDARYIGNGAAGANAPEFKTLKAKA